MTLISPYTFISPDGNERVATSMNMSNISEFTSVLNELTVQYALGDVDNFAGTNSFPAVVMTEPLVVEIGSTDDPQSEQNFMETGQPSMALISLLVMGILLGC